MKLGARGRWLAFGAAAMLAFVGCTDEAPGPVGPSTTETPVVSPSPGTPEPSASPQTEEEQAVADAIEIYKAFLFASHLSTSNPHDDQLLEAVLSLTTEDGPIRDAVAAETEYLREQGITLEGEPVVKRISATSVDLESGVVWLASCLDLSDLSTSGSAQPPAFFIEDIELHAVNGRWLVNFIDGEEATC